MEKRRIQSVKHSKRLQQKSQRKSSEKNKRFQPGNPNNQPPSSTKSLHHRDGHNLNKPRTPCSPRPWPRRHTNPSANHPPESHNPPNPLRNPLIRGSDHYIKASQPQQLPLRFLHHPPETKPDYPPRNPQDRLQSTPTRLGRGTARGE
ncbi:hypothetical protein Droror1_Dr00002029 [Drosera rotundifolia]